jgi:transposase
MRKKTFRYRLYPTATQVRALLSTLDECRWLYNRLLEESRDAAWSEFTRKLSYKAEWAGRKFVKVDPAYTSQDCSRCGSRQAMPLSAREYECPNCGLELDRDHNAAINILTLGLQSQEFQEAPRSP